MLHSVDQLKNYDIQGTDGAVGKIRGFYFDDLNWEIHYMVVDLNQWLSGRKVLVSPAVVGTPESDESKLPVALSKDAIDNSPAIEDDSPLARSRDDELNTYYGWRTISNVESDTDWDQEFEGGEGDLRSTYEVKDFYVESEDGDIGHVEDFIIDDHDWTIKYIVLHTKNWWPAKKVLIPVESVDSIGWDDEKLFVALSQEEIKSAPEFNKAELRNLESKDNLFSHLGGKNSWIEHRPDI